MSIASRVADVLRGSNTFTIRGGYCLKAGQTVRFPTGVQEMETRNDKGQVSKARYIYADGSRLTYTRLPENNFRLQVTEAGA